jgi:hypothetical protein
MTLSISVAVATWQLRRTAGWTTYTTHMQLMACSRSPSPPYSALTDEPPLVAWITYKPDLASSYNFTPWRGHYIGKKRRYLMHRATSNQPYASSVSSPSGARSRTPAIKLPAARSILRQGRYCIDIHIVHTRAENQCRAQQWRLVFAEASSLLALLSSSSTSCCWCRWHCFSRAPMERRRQLRAR